MNILNIIPWVLVIIVLAGVTTQTPQFKEWMARRRANKPDDRKDYYKPQVQQAKHPEYEGIMVSPKTISLLDEVRTKEGLKSYDDAINFLNVKKSYWKHKYLFLKGGQNA